MASRTTSLWKTWQWKKRWFSDSIQLHPCTHVATSTVMFRESRFPTVGRPWFANFQRKNFILSCKIDVHKCFHHDDSEKSFQKPKACWQISQTIYRYCCPPILSCLPGSCWYLESYWCCPLCCCQTKAVTSPNSTHRLKVSRTQLFHKKYYLYQRTWFKIWNVGNPWIFPNTNFVPSTNSVTKAIKNKFPSLENAIPSPRRVLLSVAPQEGSSSKIFGFQGLYPQSTRFCS